MARQFRPTGLKKGAFLNWIGLAINFSVAFVVTPIVIRTLGSSGFGMWALIQSFSGYYGLVNLGLGSALQRFITRDLAKQENRSLQETVGTAITFFLSTGLLVLLAAAVLSTPAAHFFSVPEAEAAAFSTTLLLCAFAVVADFFSALAGTLFTAREQFTLSSTLGISRQLVQSMGVLFVLGYSPSIKGLALVVCAVSITALLVNWGFARRLYPQLSLSWRGASYARLKELLHFGTSTVLLTVSNIVRLRIGNVIIAKTVGLSSVATFSVAANLVVNMNSIMASSLNVLNPRLTRLHTQENMEELKRLYRSALFVSSTMACGMGLMIMVFGERFILLWVGEEFLPAVPILHVLTLAYVVAHAQAPAWNVMFALAKHHLMAKVAVAEAVVILGLGLWLSSTHGALGFAWATAAAMLVTKVFIQPPYAAKLGGLRVIDYLVPMAIPFLISTLIWGTTYVLHLSATLRASGLLFAAATAGTIGFCYLFLVWLFGRRRSYAPAFVAKLFGKKQRAAESPSFH